MAAELAYKKIQRSPSALEQPESLRVCSTSPRSCSDALVTAPRAHLVLHELFSPSANSFILHSHVRHCEEGEFEASAGPDFRFASGSHSPSRLGPPSDACWSPVHTPGVLNCGLDPSRLTRPTRELAPPDLFVRPRTSREASSVRLPRGDSDFGRLPCSGHSNCLRSDRSRPVGDLLSVGLRPDNFVRAPLHPPHHLRSKNHYLKNFDFFDPTDPQPLTS